MGNIPPLKQSREQTLRATRDLGSLLAFTLALHVPFLAQAFTIDDVSYLDIARNVFRNPLFPLDLPYVFEGVHVSMRGHPHPPLNSYFIAGLLLLSGRTPSEIILHASYLFFPMLATVCFYFLARRFVEFPVLATAIFVCVPTLVVTAHSIMTDVALLAAWLCATTLFVYGIDRSDPRLAGIAALPLVAAAFFAYQGLALVPLLACYAFQRKKLKKELAVMLVLPALFIFTWQGMGSLHAGSAYSVTLFGYLRGLGLWMPAVKIRNAITTLTYVGGTTIFFPFLFIAFGRRWKILAMALGTGALVARYLPPGYDFAQRAFFIFCFAGGSLAALWALLHGLERVFAKTADPDTVFLSLWFLGVLFYCALIFITGAARYVLPAAPPLILLLVRSNQSRLAASRFGRAFYASLLACQLLIGLLLAQADYQFASVFRTEAKDFQQRYLLAGDSFIFSAEWGLRYYLTQAGGQIMAEDSAGRPGELVVKSRACNLQKFPSKLDPDLRIVDQRTYRMGSPLRLLNRHANAGFWGSAWGTLPFWFSNQPVDELDVYKIVNSH